MSAKNITRRNFIEKTAITAGMSALIPSAMTSGSVSVFKDNVRNSREVWIACVSLMNMHALTSELMVNQIFEILKESEIYKPDFVCLPELFPFSNVEKQSTPDERVTISDEVLLRFSDYSRQNNCYTVCPVNTRRDGRIFNSAVVFDRSGSKIGLYEKIHLTDYEIKDGYSCGPLFQPVIKTEFGPIGIQICFDIEWDDGWTMLRKQGAKIIFWPSAFSGGKCVSTKAWEHKCIVAAATGKNTARLCDISGEVIAQTGIWNSNLYCAPLNMEKAFLHTWPAVLRFGEIQKQYGRNIRITNFHEEEWSVIESLSPDVNVMDILKEYELKTHEQLTLDTELLQQKSRG
jgi:beta-ureidopropionase